MRDFFNKEAEKFFEKDNDKIAAMASSDKRTFMRMFAHYTTINFTKTQKDKIQKLVSTSEKMSA